MNFRSLFRLALTLLVFIACDSPSVDREGGPIAEWPAYRAGIGGGGFSPLEQLSPENVDRLEVAWPYRTGFEGGNADVYEMSQNTPILVDGNLYICTPDARVISLDPETGEERWIFDAKLNMERVAALNCRGVSHWRDPSAEPGTPCEDRIVFGTVDARLLQVDAWTGERCREFGSDGQVDLRDGIGEIVRGEYGVTSPPLIASGLVITGAMVADNQRLDAPSGVVRAYDAKTGRQVWSWNPVPPDAVPIAEGESGLPIYRRGTANAWSILSADEELGHVYVPTGNTSPDYWGGQRDGLDHYSSSVVALDIASGEVAWHFRTVHHDIWDYDVTPQPTLLDFPQASGPAIPALVIGTKMGYGFFLDRRNGKPIFPVEERRSPQMGVVQGDYVTATQPYPTKPRPLHPLTLTPDDAFGFTFYDRRACRRMIEERVSEGIFTPPSLQGSIHYPGLIGGINWGSLAVDASRQLVIVNTQRIATSVRLVPREEYEASLEDGSVKPGTQPQHGTPYAAEVIPLLSPFGAPCNPPPWGTLVAIQFPSGDVAWEVTLGTSRDQAPFPIYLFADTGAPNLGGPIVTASGLTFIAATTDFYLRAFETATGTELWRGRLPTSAQATPMTYRVRPDGRQYVVISAGGHLMLGTPLGDSVIAFALP